MIKPLVQRNISLFFHKFLILILFLFVIGMENARAEQLCSQPFAMNLPCIEKNSQEAPDKRTRIICKNNALILSSRKKTLQRIELPESGMFHLADIDEDSNSDLVIVEGGGNPNSTMWVWFYNSKAGKFDNPQEIGVFEFFKDLKGYRVISSKGSANSWRYVFHSVEKRKLVPKLELNISLEEENTKCTLRDGMTRKELALTDYFKKYYCSHYEEKRESPVLEDYLRHP